MEALAGTVSEAALEMEAKASAEAAAAIKAAASRPPPPEISALPPPRDAARMSAGRALPPSPAGPIYPII